MRIRMTGRRALATVLASASAVAMAALPAGAATNKGHHASHHATKVHAAIKLGMGYPLQADGYPVYYGIAKGIFKKYGLNIEETNLTPAAGVSALYSGSIDILFDGSGTVNEAIQTGQVKSIATYSQVPVWFVAMPSEHFKPLKTIADLKEFDGKTIGASTPGSLVTDVELNLAKQAHSTAKFDYLGASSPVVALQHGLVDTIAATPATLPIAKADGAVVLGSINKLANGRGLYTLVGGNNSYLAHNKRVLRVFNQAYHAALKAANQHTSSLLPILEQSLSSTKGEALQSYSLQRRYEFFTPVPLSDIRAVIADITPSLPQAANAKPQSLVDNTALFG